MRRLIMTWCILTTPLAMAETWVCRHDSPDREELTFMPKSDGTVAWQHQKLGALDPLAVVVNTDSLLTMATQRLNILYSRFFHLDKFSGRMGETTFRAATLRRLAEKDPDLNWEMVTTVWQCESKRCVRISSFPRTLCDVTGVACSPLETCRVSEFKKWFKGYRISKSIRSDR